MANVIEVESYLEAAGLLRRCERGSPSRACAGRSTARASWGCLRMLLFLVACNASEDVRERAPEALRRAAGFVANLDLDDLTSYTSPSRRTLVLALGHPQPVATPRRYVAQRPGSDVVLFDGLPLYPDGGLVLDAERLGERWEDARRLEGPGAALRPTSCADEVELVTGPLGLLPVFACDSPSGGQLSATRCWRCGCSPGWRSRTRSASARCSRSAGRWATAR